MQKFYTQNLRLATRCQKLKAIVEKNQSTTAKILREISKLVNPHQLAFISAQIINSGKFPSKRVWSPQMKNIMVGLLRVSPPAFRLVIKFSVIVIKFFYNGSCTSHTKVICMFEIHFLKNTLLKIVMIFINFAEAACISNSTKCFISLSRLAFLSLQLHSLFINLF